MSCNTRGLRFIRVLQRRWQNMLKNPRAQDPLSQRKYPRRVHQARLRNVGKDGAFCAVCAKQALGAKGVLDGVEAIKTKFALPLGVGFFEMFFGQMQQGPHQASIAQHQKARAFGVRQDVLDQTPLLALERQKPYRLHKIFFQGEI